MIGYCCCCWLWPAAVVVCCCCCCPPLVTSPDLLVVGLGHVPGQETGQDDPKDMDDNGQEDSKSNGAQIVQDEVDNQAVATLGWEEKDLSRFF